MLHLADTHPPVRSRAVRSLVSVCRAVKSLPSSDVNVFPEYILPIVNPLCSDVNESVRAELASHIAELAHLSLHFLNMAYAQRARKEEEDENEEEEEIPLESYDAEVNSLHDKIGQMVSVLMADQANSVKQTVLEAGLEKLARFFGKTKANDVILSHMITFLNDKDDAQLRDSFYRSVAAVAAYVGWPSPQIIVPLLLQGLADPEEAVIASCVVAMADLAQPDLMNKQTLYQLLEDAAPYLLHPNQWIRQAVIGKSHSGYRAP